MVSVSYPTSTNLDVLLVLALLRNSLHQNRRVYISPSISLDMQEEMLIVEQVLSAFCQQVMEYT
jgi:hypothetical protein